jgi:hypothetical protein
MTAAIRRNLLIALIAFCAGIAGALTGRNIMPPLPPHRLELHDFLHNELDLDARQHARLDILEAGFAVDKRELETQLRGDNARLAGAMASEHADGPLVNAAVDRSHQAMGALQKATLAHVFAMRAILNPDQTARFDTAVTRALTDEGP